MKLICISLGSWLIGLSAILFMFVVVEGESLAAADLKTATITSLAIAALLFSLAYAPSLYWLRKRLGGCRPAALFPVASALVINLPVFLIGIFAIGRTLGVAEAFAFIGAFVLMGTTFGLAFVWNYRSGELQSAKWSYLKQSRNRPVFPTQQTSLRSLISTD
jgi:uncharacterized membrane-anchored protein YitT (DUF2179 family)